MTHRIKELRTKKGMTLLQLADRLGIAESTVQRYESGTIANLKYETMVKLADIFNVTPQYLMGWDDDPKPLKLDYALFGKDEPIMAIYENLNNDGQERLRAYAEDLKASGRYRK